MQIHRIYNKTVGNGSGRAHGHAQIQPWWMGAQGQGRAHICRSKDGPMGSSLSGLIPRLRTAELGRCTERGDKRKEDSR